MNDEVTQNTQQEGRVMYIHYMKSVSSFIPNRAAVTAM